MEFHPVAEIFPMMTAEEHEKLKADIAANGLQQPIWTYQGKVIDGRNRYQACTELKITPTFREWQGNEEALVAFTVGLNLHRRHLNAGQLAEVALAVEEYEATAAKERQRASGGDKKSTEAKVAESVVATLPQPIKSKAREKAAKATGASARNIQNAKKLKAEAPDLLAMVRSGAITINDAMRQLKERGREAEREKNRKLVADAPPAIVQTAEQKYSTIVIDPPWDWGDEGDADQFGRARPTYGTMPFSQILELPVSALAEKNAHIYLWITNRSLPKGFELLEAWGFRYVTALTWCKPSIGMGNYFRGSTEHVLFGVRGSLPLLRRDLGTWFQADRPGRHSAKPDAFFDLVEQASPGPWLEMFARQQRRGWASWGAEV